jgi:hypothetical protein
MVGKYDQFLLYNTIDILHVIIVDFSGFMIMLYLRLPTITKKNICCHRQLLKLPKKKPLPPATTKFSKKKKIYVATSNTKIMIFF